MTIPLHSPDLQRAVLGAALLDNSLMRGPLAQLAVTDFVGSSDQTIFGLILEFYEDGRPFDPITICEELRQRNQLERVAGVAYIAALPDGVVVESSLINSHAKTLQKLSRAPALAYTGRDAPK